MDLYLTIGHIACLSFGVALWTWLMLHDFQSQNGWVRVMVLCFGGAQIAIIVVTLVALVVVLVSPSRLNWVDLAVSCTLQSIVFTNVSSLVASFTSGSYPHRTLADG
jgi:hypothetical protein